MNLRDLSRFGVGALALVVAAPAVADVQYVYDSAGRLVKAIYSNGVTIEYRYDAAGNRTQIVTTAVANSPPVAVNDSATTGVSTAIDISVRANDSDPNGNPLTITSLGTPTGGSATILGAGTYVRYTAPASAGVKTFTYTISDGAGGTASATVSVTVTSAQAPPVAEDDYEFVTANHAQAFMLLANDTDANGDTLTIISVSNVTGGSAVIAPGGGYVTYYAGSTVGTESFDYVVSDGHGGTDTGSVGVQVGCDFSGPEMCEVQ